MLRTVILVCTALLTVPAIAQRPGRGYPPDLPDATQEIYKSVADVELPVYIFRPKESDTDAVARPSPRPAIVFFFGGGWRGGSPEQFSTHARYLAERGMVAVCADYRVSSRHDVTPIECVEDAKAAMRYVRENAERLGIDPNRIAAAGGSAGGHLAACTGVVGGFEPSDAATSSRADALVLFNPVVQLAPFGDARTLGAEIIERIDAKTGGRGKEISPLHSVGENEPPTLILHGVDDPTVPYATVRLFGEEMRKQGNRCEVVGFKGQKHGFFNNRKGRPEMYQATTRLMDEFLTSLGWLSGEPTLPMPVAEEELIREK